MKTRIIALALSLVAANYTTQAAGLVNGGFETPSAIGTGAYYPYYDPVPAGFGWSIASGGIDQIGSYWQASSGQNSIDLSGFSPGTIYQDITFPTAGTWAVKFDMSVNPDAGGNRSVGVKFGLASGSLSSVGNFTMNSAGRTLANMAWEGKTTAVFTVNSSSTYRLEFSALDGDGSGAALDNVTIVQVVPEPGVAAMGLVGAAMVFARFGKRSRKT